MTLFPEAKWQDVQQELGMRQEELTGELMQIIGEVVSTIAQEGGYALIVDVSSGAVVAADPLLDPPGT